MVSFGTWENGERAMRAEKCEAWRLSIDWAHGPGRRGTEALIERIEPRRTQVHVSESPILLSRGAR
jgi:hypothetical protein